MTTIRTALSRGTTRLREQRGLTRKELAEAAGVGIATLWQLEKHSSIPHGPTLTRLAEALGVSEVELAVAGEGEG